MFSWLGTVPVSFFNEANFFLNTETTTLSDNEAARSTDSCVGDEMGSTALYTRGVPLHFALKSKADTACKLRQLIDDGSLPPRNILLPPESKNRDSS